ncbi:MBL fold metallo-hydrolase [Altererythrobacter salegens]|uniref:MBL fold metallo-hydrolase n=1 Tax=Croceibacterium salegens TaxID=1737568 RepID=A0A6I4SY16_9SPHN|nr:MBL fold metallo-hydrolase [Croceibacterium salegens]MXO60984.1 MBL fold metallo-hydrolase [Croceibacterium salegens]
MKVSTIRAMLGLLAVVCTMLGGSAATAQDSGSARNALEQAAEAMGGLDRLEALDTLVLTGFGQRVYYQGGGFLTGDPKAPPKWQAVVDAQRTFDLKGERAVYQERWAQEFPFAGFFGLNFARNATLQGGAALLDHPLPALLEALDAETRLGGVSTESGAIVVEFTPAGASSPAWLGIDPRTHLPVFSRWISGSVNLGDLTTTAWFTGYTPVQGVQLPLGLMQQLDWREQISLMFQVDSYRLDVAAEQLPAFPRALVVSVAPAAAQATKVADGVWDVRVGTAGGPVIEFADRLVMFEAYGGEAQTLARIDAANALVPGKQVQAVIVSHHHFDHTGGLRAAVSRGLEVISQRGNEGIIREMVTRPAAYYPDALARSPHPLVFTPVDDTLVLEDATRRLEIYRVVEHAHMPDAVFAYLPKERIMMEGDFGDEAWQLHFWGGALAANIAHYGIAPLTDVAVHGSGPLSIEQTLANDQKQIDAAKEWCRTTEAGGRYVFGCPVQYDTTGPVALEPR